MLNWIFAGLVLGSVLVGGAAGTLKQVSDASTEAAKTSVTLALGLVGNMALWLGFMGVLKEAGLLAGLARLLKPVMTRLFPDVPADHPAMGAMLMNLAANILGLGNAATPFGLRAMAELDRLNPRRGVATDAMALFLVINTSGVAVLPLGVMATRAALGSASPGAIVLPSILGTLASTVVAVLICKLIQRLPRFAVERVGAVEVAAARAPTDAAAEPQPTPPALPVAGSLALALVALVMAGLFVRSALVAPEGGLALVQGLLDQWLTPLLMSAIVLVGVARRVKVYEAFVAAAKEGFTTAVTIIPYLVAIIVSFAMFRASGAMTHLAGLLSPATSAVGLPSEVLPMALIRPFSGSGAFGVMTELLNTHKPDSFIGALASLVNGSSETTFYVLAVYFGAVQVRATRHTLPACLTADLVGLLITVALAHLFFGHLPLSLMAK